MEQFSNIVSWIKSIATDRPVIIAIDGNSTSGKSTLAWHIAEKCDCTVLHMDDFFLQPHQRTAQRFAEIGGNIAYERFKSEVLDPLQRQETVYYRAFDCQTGALKPTIEVSPRKITIIEGVYSLHPHFRDAYTGSIFLHTDTATQQKRILSRNGQDMLMRFINEWIPLEARYFESLKPRESCDIFLDTSNLY